MKLVRNVRFREEKFGGVLFETRSEKVYALNTPAAAIVREIAAGGTAAEVAARLVPQFHDSKGVAQIEAGAFIEELQRRGLVEEAAG